MIFQSCEEWVKFFNDQDLGLMTSIQLHSLFMKQKTVTQGLFFQISQSISKLIQHYLKYIGRRGISLSGSYQQGYSTTYNTRSHIKVVCNGYILTHILN